ncbi:PCNA-interacting partner isoform 16-T16 [Rhynchocyon petersi]
MAVLYQKSILDMMKQFRRNWHTLCNSERTTVCGADSMLLALQLSMADSNKQMRLLAKKIISSYLNLLINSKNDLALAHILNIPDRGLGREAFTDLKHAAQEKQMSIFLVATSFIRTIQLGGKGYAPSPSDPLRTHVKGLSNFISFIDKLVEILGEIPDPRSPTQMNNSVVKPLRERIQATLQEKKNTKKQLLIRSQFACTYKDDGMISKDKWNSINSASKPWFVLPKENDPSEGVNSSVGRPAIGTSSGNVQLDNSKNKIKSRKSTGETGNKNSKRKKVDLDDENILCDDGTELLHQNNTKIPKTSKDSQNKLNVKLAGVAKGKSTTKDKLIIGQTKLTQFFRL